MSDILWQFEGVTLLGNQRPRLEDVSLEIRRGATAIVGYSGAGKTSLLNLLTRFEVPHAGTIRATLPRDGNRLPLYWLPQTGGLWPHLTVAQHLLAVMPPGPDNRQHRERLLRDFDIDGKAGEYPDRLSEGECARLALARTLCSRAAILVMDEPLVHVDPARLGKYWRVVRTHFAETGAAILIATHSAETVLREAERVVCLKEGRVMYVGDVDDLYYRPPSLELAEFLGPANWLTPDEANHWLDGRGAHPSPDPSFPISNLGIGSGLGTRGTSRCFRPEQIMIQRCDDGPFVVESSQFAGSVAEVQLRDERTSRTRSFFHRPAADTLHPGDRVLLQVCLMMLVVLLTLGCGNPAGPELKVGHIAYWPMPPVGHRIPAPRSIAVGPENEIYVLDTAGRVVVFDESGRAVQQWKMPEYEIGRPEGVLVLKDGRVAVADTHYHRVVFFDRKGKPLEMMGSFGKEPGQFIYPVGLAQDDQENLYVCEYGENDRVQKFSVDGRFLLQFGRFGTGPGEFQRPSKMIWQGGRVFVADAINNRIQVFSDSGEFLKILGESDQRPALQYPYDIASGRDGVLYVVEYGAGRVSKIDQAGKLLGRFGSTGSGEGQFATPWGLAVDVSHSRLFVADTGNRRIVELQF
jgi:ABC-type multidrug transport system ATPase subunit/sugar lactone lactonase YvrE